MTVKELIARLQDQDPEATVHIAYPSGDYWRTTLAPEATDVDELSIKMSDYHGKPALGDYDDDDDAIVAVVIS